MKFLPIVAAFLVSALLPVTTFAAGKSKKKSPTPSADTADKITAVHLTSITISIFATHAGKEFKVMPATKITVNGQPTQLVTCHWSQVTCPNIIFPCLPAARTRHSSPVTRHFNVKMLLRCWNSSSSSQSSRFSWCSSHQLSRRSKLGMTSLLPPRQSPAHWSKDVTTRWGITLMFGLASTKKT
jgi:hypothetical protein